MAKYCAAKKKEAKQVAIRKEIAAKKVFTLVILFYAHHAIVIVHAQL